MRIIILAGGEGTRLHELTRCVNKHLLPVGKWPVITHVLHAIWPISREALLITNAKDISSFATLFNSNNHPYHHYDSILFAAQHKPDGIADALRYGKTFCDGGPAFVILGDNLFSEADAAQFRDVCDATHGLSEFGAHIWTKRIDAPESYGVLVLDDDGHPTEAVEKPQNKVSDLAIVGAYLFDSALWTILPKLKRSSRGQYEIIDVLQYYIQNNSLHHHELTGDWIDIGESIPKYLEAIASR